MNVATWSYKTVFDLLFYGSYAFTKLIQEAWKGLSEHGVEYYYIDFDHVDKNKIDDVIPNNWLMLNHFGSIVWSVETSVSE